MLRRIFAADDYETEKLSWNSSPDFTFTRTIHHDGNAGPGLPFLKQNILHAINHEARARRAGDISGLAGHEGGNSGYGQGGPYSRDAAENQLFRLAAWLFNG